MQTADEVPESSGAEKVLVQIANEVLEGSGADS